MNMKHTVVGLAIAMLTFGLLGCDEYGKVDQGRVIAYDKEKQTVTVIQDKAMDAQNPDYSILPPHTYTMPVDPAERGADPKAGLRMKLDLDAKIVRIFDTTKKEFTDVPITIVDVQKNIDKQHPLVFDKDKGEAKKFPVVDKDKKTITIFSGRQKLLATFSVPEEYIALPDMAWDSGDEVRVYFKTQGTALRFMNISKTDIFKK